MLCSANHELTQDNIDGGAVTSAVFARGEASDGQSVLGQDTVTRELGQAASLSLGTQEESMRSNLVASNWSTGSANAGWISLVHLCHAAGKRDRQTRAGRWRCPRGERAQVSHSLTAFAKDCISSVIPLYFFPVEVGVFSDEDGDGLGDADETMIYTTTIVNTGNVRVGGTKVSHLLAQDSAIVCDNGFEAATSADVSSSM